MCDVDPLTPHVNIVKLGFTVVYIIFALKHRLWVLVLIEAVLTCNEAVLTCTHNLYLSKMRKLSEFFHWKIGIFTAVKYGSILHRCVIIMNAFS